MFKKYLKIIIALILLAFLQPCFGAEIKENKPLTLILDWFANPNHAPIFVAQQEGFFQREGITVNIINPADPADPPKLVAAGKADLAITYQPQLVQQVSQGLPLVRIATLINTPLNCLAVAASSKIKSIKALKGKTIGYSSGAIDEATLRVMLKQQGLTLADVNLINVRYNLSQALMTGKVDAIIGIMRNFEPLEMELAGKPARLFYVEDNGMPSYDELVIVANRGELNDPRLPKFLKALQSGVDFLQAHPEESWRKFAKAHPELSNELNRRAFAATLPHFASNPAQLNKEKYIKLADFLRAQKLIQSAPPLNLYAIELSLKN